MNTQSAAGLSRGGSEQKSPANALRATTSAQNIKDQAIRIIRGLVLTEYQNIKTICDNDEKTLLPKIVGKNKPELITAYFKVKEMVQNTNSPQNHELNELIQKLTPIALPDFEKHLHALKVYQAIIHFLEEKNAYNDNEINCKAQIIIVLEVICKEILNENFFKHLLNEMMRPDILLFIFEQLKQHEIELNLIQINKLLAFSKESSHFDQASGCYRQHIELFKEAVIKLKKRNMLTTIHITAVIENFNEELGNKILKANTLEALVACLQPSQNSTALINTGLSLSNAPRLDEKEMVPNQSVSHTIGTYHLVSTFEEKDYILTVQQQDKSFRVKLGSKDIHEKLQQARPLTAQLLWDLKIFEPVPFDRSANSILHRAFYFNLLNLVAGPRGNPFDFISKEIYDALKACDYQPPASRKKKSCTIM